MVCGEITWRGCRTEVGLIVQGRNLLADARGIVEMALRIILTNTDGFELGLLLVVQLIDGEWRMTA